MAQRYILSLLIIGILFATLVSAAVNLNVTSPAASTLMNGSYPVTFTFDGNANVTIEFYNGTWNTVNTSNNATSYTYFFDTTGQIDAASSYQFNITVTNYTNATRLGNKIKTFHNHTKQ